MALFGGVFCFVYLVFIVLVVAGYWKTFEKAGKPGWAGDRSDLQLDGPRRDRREAELVGPASDHPVRRESCSCS